MILPTEENIKTITDLRENIIKILESLKMDSGPKFIFYKSRPRAVLLSLSEYKKLLELIEDYQDALDASEAISDSKAKKEKVYSFKEVAEIVGY